MKRLHAAIAFAALSLAACATPGTGSAYLTPDDPDAGYNNFLQMQQQAQAAAYRPGDEAMTCAELEAEFTTVSADPAIANAMAAATANGVTQNGVNTAMQGQMAVNNALAAFGAAGGLQLPGSDIFTLVAAQASAAHVNYQAGVSQSAMAGSLNSLADTQVPIYRQQRLAEVAMAKACKFIEG